MKGVEMVSTYTLRRGIWTEEGPMRRNELRAEQSIQEEEEVVKGPQTDICWTCLKNSKEASVT